MQKPIIQIPANDIFGVLNALQNSLDNQHILFVTKPEVNGISQNEDFSDLDIFSETAVIVESSGSTGKPKKIQLSSSSLLYSARKSMEILGGPGQWLLALPTNFIAGLQVLTRSIVSDYQPVLMNTQLPFTVEAFVRGASLMDAPRRYTSLVPTQLSRLAAEIDQDAFLFSVLRKFDAILVGGQQPDWDVVQKLRSLGVNVVVTYGMTETCGGCVYDGVPMDGVEVTLEQDQIKISGPVLALGLGNSFLTNDLGKFEGGKLEVLGRLDRVIISGGIKVSLDLVEQHLANLSGVSEAVAVPIESQEWGQRVGIAYSGSPEIDLSEPLVRMVGQAAKPLRVKRFTQLPRLSSGKPDLIEIQNQLSSED